MSDVRTITVVKCDPKKRKDGTIVSGPSKFGGEDWTMYEVMAVDDTGLPIQEDLITFAPLPLGEGIQCEFVAKHDPQYGTSYTLKQTSGTKVASQPSRSTEEYEMLRESVRMVTERVAALEAHLGLTITGAGRTDVPGVVEPAVPVGSVADDSEPPF